MIYRFNNFEFSEEAGLLRRDGTVIKLRPKEHDVLTYFLRHPKRQISRYDLLRHAWPDVNVEAINISDVQNIQRAISGLRKRLGDTHHTLIETVHGRGRYCFVAEVDVFPEPETDKKQAPSNTFFLEQLPHGRNPHFTGRDALLEELRETLANQSITAIALWGLGGIGKTQIALAYAYQYAHLYSVIWWVRGDDITGLDEDYVKLAAALQLSERTWQDRMATKVAVRRWLEAHSDWLLIIDNADEPGVLRDYLPSSSTGHMLITSRNPNWRAMGAVVHPVPILNRTDAVAFLLERTGKADHASAQMLAETLGDLPLALEQAGAYIETTGCSIPDYQKLFEHKSQELLRRGVDFIEYRDTVGTTWELAFQNVENTSAHAAALLRLCAFLAPDEISFDLFRVGSHFLPDEFRPLAEDPITLNDACSVLRRYSLIERSADSVSLHRLVQRVVRDRLSIDARQQWIVIALRFIAGMSSHALLSRDALSPHALTVIRFVQELPHIEEYLRHELTLQMIVGESLTAIQGYTATDVELAYNRALTLCQELGETPQMRAVLSGLWQSKLVRGDLATARYLSQQYMEMRHGDAESMSQASYARGITAFYLGDFSRAHRLLMSSLLPMEALSPSAQPDPEKLGIHIASMTYQSFATWFLGYPEQAQDYMTQAIVDARELGHAFTSTLVFDHAAVLSQWLGDVQKVVGLTDSIKELVATHGFPIWATRYECLRGWVDVMQGEIPIGVSRMWKGDVSYAHIGASLFRTFHLAMLAEAIGATDPHEALSMVSEAFEIVEQTNERFWEAELHRVRGSILLALSPENVADAAHCYEDALRTARQQKSKSLELRATMHLAFLWQREGKRDKAHALLSSVYGWFTEGLDTVDLQKAKAMLKELT